MTELVKRIKILFPRSRVRAKLIFSRSQIFFCIDSLLKFLMQLRGQDHLIVLGYNGRLVMSFNDSYFWPMANFNFRFFNFSVGTLTAIIARNKKPQTATKWFFRKLQKQCQRDVFINVCLLSYFVIEFYGLVW